MEHSAVKYNSYYNKWTDKNGGLGEHPDQYPTLKHFMADIWKRYRPWGGKQYFIKSKLFQVLDTDELICMDENSKFYKQTVENYYLTRPLYSELKSHYFASKRLHKKY